MLKNKKVLLSFVCVLLIALTFGGYMASKSKTSSQADSTSWNFKDSNFKSLGKISSTVTIDDLTLIATSSKTMQIKSNSKVLNGTTYSHCLATGGAGNLSYRSIKVPVKANSTIKVILMSSGSSERTLAIANSNQNQLATLSAKTSLTEQSYTYTGNDNYIYLYSTNSAINIYKIEVISNSTTTTTAASTSSQTTVAPTAEPTSTVVPTSTVAPTATATSNTTNLTLSDIPSNYKTSLDWIYTNRIVKEGSATRRNLIFDQIHAGNGTLNFVVKWQSTLSVTLKQRQLIEQRLSENINAWTSYLVNYDGWKYDTIDVNVVGWAVPNASQIIDKQSDEVIYTTTTTDTLDGVYSVLPYAPSELSRFEHFTDSNYTYPGTRFDMYLWGTDGFQGGAGGDWGQRVSADYILQGAESGSFHIVAHEMGHGFGLTDFYEEADRPTGGFPAATIMWAGNSSTITDYDGWMLRYVWSKIKDESGRF